MSFKNLQLHEDILKAIEDAGYTQPTPIQEQAIPQVLAGHDLLASAQTGSGKTGAFIIPALHKLTTPSLHQGSGPRVLILVPTRELAMQVAEQGTKYSKYMKSSKTVCIYGGAPYPIQIRQLTRPHDILVATPGRLIDHIQSGKVNLSRVEFFVLDEADRMLDMGFIDPVEEIKAKLPKSIQTLFFSATLKGNVMKLAGRLLKNPVRVEIEQAGGKHENIEQFLCPIDDLGHKLRLLDHLLKDESVNQAIVFSSTKSYCDELVEELIERGHNAASLHGDLNQRKRTQRINGMKDGRIRILVATDVAARGIDLQTITHVFNFDLPRCTEDYVHRIGRTGRAHNKGVAYSFAGRRDRDLVRNIERFTGQKIQILEVEGLKSKRSEPRSSFQENGGDTRSEGREPRRSSFRPKERFESRREQFRPRDGFQKSRPYDDFKKRDGFSADGNQSNEGSTSQEGFKPRQDGFKPRDRFPPRRDGFKKRDGFSSDSNQSREGSSSQEGFKPRREGFKKRDGFKPRQDGFKKRDGFKSKSGFKSYNER